MSNVSDGMEAINTAHNSTHDAGQGKPGKQEKSRSWIITGPGEVYDRDYIFEALDRYDAFVGQYEIGEQATQKNPDGYYHFHVYLEHSTPIRFATLKKRFPKANIVARRGSRQEAYDYVLKAGSRVGEPFSHGTIDLQDHQGKRSDLEYCHAQIKAGRSVNELMSEDYRTLRYVNALRDLQSTCRQASIPKYRQVSVAYLYGPPRCGKTRRVTDMYEPGQYCRKISYGTTTDRFDEYDGEEVLILDDFNSGIKDISVLLNALDGHYMNLPARYRDSPAAYTTVWIIANIPLERQYRELKQSAPEQWNAFVSRIGMYIRMDGDGKVYEQRLPAPATAHPWQRADNEPVAEAFKPMDWQTLTHTINQ